MQIIHSTHDRKLISERDALAIMNAVTAAGVVSRIQRMLAKTGDWMDGGNGIALLVEHQLSNAAKPAHVHVGAALFCRLGRSRLCCYRDLRSETSWARRRKYWYLEA